MSIPSIQYLPIFTEEYVVPPLNLVDTWLTHHDIDTPASQRTGGQDWITVTVSVAQAEALLGTKYNVYHPKSSEYVVRTQTPHRCISIIFLG